MRPILYKIIIGIIYSVMIASLVGIIMGYEAWVTPIQYYRFHDQTFNPIRSHTKLIKRDQDDTFIKTLHILAVVYSISIIILFFLYEGTVYVIPIFIMILLLLLFNIFITNKLDTEKIYNDSCKNDYYTNLKPLYPFNCERANTYILTISVVLLLLGISISILFLPLISKSVNKQLWYFGLYYNIL